MDQAKPLAVSLRRLLASVTIVMLAIAAIGAYPAWWLAQEPGLLAGTVSAATVLVVMVASAVVVAQAAQRSAMAATVAFLVAGAARMVLCGVVVVAAIATTDLPATALLIWLLAFYLATLAAEGVWLARAMRRAQDEAGSDGGGP